MYFISDIRRESLNIWKSFDCTNVVRSQQEIRVFTRESSGHARSQEPWLREGLERVYFTEPKNTEAFAACVSSEHVPSLGLA